MGSPISGILAEIKLRYLEEEIKKKIGRDIVFWVRYVDDIFAVIEKNGEPEKILEIINEMDRNIKFTLEEEKNNTLNYLDVKIERTEENNLETTVYRKPNASTEIIKANCKTPYNYKIAALRSYINRAINICSNEELLKEEMDKIKTIAEKNGYRKELINKLYKKRINTLNKIESAPKPKKQNTLSIPYCKGATSILKKEANKFNINIPIKPNPNIYQRVKSDRDTIDQRETSGIYKLEYKNHDNGKTGNYIGLTKRKIKTRAEEHQKDIRDGKTGTAIAKLAITDNIEIKFNEIKKLANYNSKNCAFYREAVEIITDRKACNDVIHRKIDNRWRHLLGIKNDRSATRNLERAEEGEKVDE